MPTIMPVTDVRRALTSLIGRLEKPIYITQHGRARAVLIDAEQFDELLEEMEDLRLACNPAWRAELARVREMVKDEASLRAAQERGDLVPLQKLEADLGLSEDELAASDADGDVPG